MGQNVEKDDIMPSKSKAQQRFFGVVRGIQKGSGKGSKAAKDVARQMDKDDVKKYASTKHKGLPNKVKQETKVRRLIRKMVREIIKEKKLTEASGVEKVLYMADHGYGKLAGKTVDGMSANLFKAVYNKANDKTKEKINKMNEKQLYVFMTKLWSKFGRQVKI